ncbi:hypothetical protein HAP94_00380 [Acidithiobacillus ferrivorans]|jgi:hypothetical protein|uniref:Uncharacterized protein n=1 Tax=mine drainage metagenome TaxID=410659 RepID=E6QJC5_9ZZZZ|nr:hypothetical protein [Acidithiobacillus ferrivorans]
MNEQLSVSLTITNDQGEIISPLVYQDVLLDGQFTSLLNTLNRLNAIKNAQDVVFNICPVDENRKPVKSGQDAHYWMVSFVIRRSGGTLTTQELLPFKTEALARNFTDRLVIGFKDERELKIKVSTDPPFIPQRPSAEVLQMVRPAPTGFSPGG